MYHIFYYCVKGYLESSKKKYYLFKLALILNEKGRHTKLKTRAELLNDMKENCR